MNQQEQQNEVQQLLNNALDAWCPEFSRKTEPMPSQMMRALLGVNAYMLDCDRVMKGQQPIRTIYPLPLPTITETDAAQSVQRIVDDISNLFGDDWWNLSSDERAETQKKWVNILLKKTPTE